MVNEAGTLSKADSLPRLLPNIALGGRGQPTNCVILHL
jgi:hypothetical protein